jgi:KDO2-lipid IV(A) lauroyltransferase
MSSRFFSFWKFKPCLSQFLQMRLNHLLLRFLPFTISRFYIRALGRIYYLLHWQERSLVRETVSQIFRGKIATGELQRKINGVFRGIFDHYHEKLFVGFAKFTNLVAFFRNRVCFQGREMLQEALAAGKGVILVTGHFGALELLPGALAVNGFPTAMICRFKTTCLREAQGRRAEWLGVNLIDADKGQSFFAAVKALKEGGILITECDEFQAWRSDPQRETHFLNHKFAADRTLQLLHQRSGAPLVAALVKRDGPQQYTCHFTPVSPGTAPVNMTVGEQCLKVLETAVQNHPEQWYQWHNFAMMIKTHRGIEYDHQASGYLAPAINLPLPDQA